MEGTIGKTLFSILLGVKILKCEVSIQHWNATLLEPKSKTQNFHHQANLYFLKPNDLYFHVGYAAKIKAIPPKTVK